VPFTVAERKRGAQFAGTRSHYRSNRDTRAEQERYEEGWERTFGKKSAQESTTKEEKAVASKGRKTRKSKGRKTKRTTAGPVWPPYGAKGARRGGKRGSKRRVYKRVKLFNPLTGRKEYSYMYRAAGGRLRRIPTNAIIGGGPGLKDFNPKLAEKVHKARKRAAERILKHGDVFIANRGKKRRKSKRTGKWNLKRYNKARAAGFSKTEAKAIAYGLKKMPKRRKRRKSTSSRKRRKSTSSRKRRKSTSSRKRRKSTSSRKRRKSTSSRKHRKSTSSRKHRKMRANPRHRYEDNRRRYEDNRRRYEDNRRRRRRYEDNRRRHPRMKRNAFMANLMAVLKTGALVGVGFMTHRVLTALACEHLFTPYVVAPEGKEPNLTLKTWEKPICGTVVGLIGVAGLSVMADKKVISGETAMSIGGGMVASLLQYVVVSALTAAEQPQAASYLSGYSNSVAYSLRGNRRRGLHRRGIGEMRSIMPRYAPVGTFEQAAAGVGEYFTGAGKFEQAAAGVGEYFVPKGTQGVGQYEPAGPLAMQAAANGIGEIDDGIRPDSNLDRVLDLAESAAGLGEYFTATQGKGGWEESQVPTQSQWIPNGPLWAGELRVKDTQSESELPAGTLATVGGNGILSG
jgi:hypothetical protein